MNAVGISRVSQMLSLDGEAIVVFVFLVYIDYYRVAFLVDLIIAD